MVQNLLSNAFAKDKNQVYWYGSVWKVADASSFKFLIENSYSEFAVDNQYLYRAQGKKVFKKIDGKSFEMINTFWSKDKTQIIYLGSDGKVMKGIDYDTFEAIDEKGTARDKNYDFWIDGYLKKKSRK